MTEGIMIALITGGLAVISNIIVVAFNNTKTLYRIDQLEKKQDKHNQLIERMFVAEAHIADMKEDIAELKDNRSL